ncbi:hypothetical protein D3C83_160780 [compost metagenome]
MADGEKLPAFVSAELGKRESAGHFHGVPVLRGNVLRAGQGGKRGRGQSNRQFAIAFHRGSSRFVV